MQHTVTPTFFIRDIPIYGDLILSPMAGFSDKPFRAICRELGSAMSYTEFVSADGLAHNNPKSWQYFVYDEVERPIAFQLFDHDVELLVVQCQRVVDRRRPDVIDINMVWHNMSAPMLVIQGRSDPRVVAAESEDLVRELKSKGKDMELLIFEDEGHDVLKYENRVACYNAITDFFAKYLKP